MAGKNEKDKRVKDKLTNSLKCFNLEGRNLNAIENVNFQPLVNMLLPGSSLEEVESLTSLQEFFYGMYDKLENNPATPMAIVDGKVTIPEHAVFHRIAKDANIENVKALSIGGIIASEWFDVLESEQEGRFCSFFTCIPNEEDLLKAKSQTWADRRKSYVKLDKESGLAMFIDINNGNVKELLKNDYFGYEYNKNHGINVNEMYPDWVVKLMDIIIEPLSPAGKNMHEDNNLSFCDWLAIPGGVPPQAINGICVNSKNKLKEHIEEISKMFPYATIFNEEQEALLRAKVLRDKENEVPPLEM